MREYTEKERTYVFRWLTQARLKWPHPDNCVPGGPVQTLLIALGVVLHGKDKHIPFPKEQESLVMWAIDTVNSVSDLFAEDSEKLARLLREYRTRDLKSS